MKNFVLIDGNALLYRAYHAFPKELTTPTGEPIGGHRRLVALADGYGSTRSLCCKPIAGRTSTSCAVETAALRRVNPTRLS